jgi:hypothetical protein
MNQNKDILILSYNEGAKKFTSEDCNEVLDKINIESPSFIIICTQESLADSKKDYQYIVKNILPKEYQLLLKIDNSSYKGSVINPYGFIKSFIKSSNKFNKNIKTNIYYNSRLVYSEKNNLEYSDYKINKYNLTKSKQNDIKYFIEKIIMRKSKKTDLGKISESTLFTTLHN